MSIGRFIWRIFHPRAGRVPAPPAPTPAKPPAPAPGPWQGDSGFDEPMRVNFQRLSGNLCHEWLHKLGFDHDFNSTARRPFSVPYAIGNLVEELAGRQLTPLPR